MSDISIPGVNGKYNTEKLIEALMEVEKQPLERVEAQQETNKSQRSVWQDINRRLSQFSDEAKNLYGFQNPFLEKTVSSSDEGVLTATVKREAKPVTQSILVKQVATGDKFLSRPVSRDYTVPEGTYSFTVGEEEVNVKFKGGKLKDLADALNQKTKGLLKASVVQNTKDTQVMRIETTKTGEHARLSFGKDSITLGLDLGIIKATTTSSFTADLKAQNLTAWSKQLSDAVISIHDGSLTVKAGGEVSIPVRPPISDVSNLTLEFEVAVKNSGKEYTPPEPPPGPSIPGGGTIQVGDISVDNAPSKVDLPPWNPPPPPVHIDDLSVLFLNKKVSLPEVEDSESFKTVQIPLADYATSISSIDLRNRNTEREVTIRNVRIFDPSVRGEYVPVHPLSEAKNAVINIEGIDIVRETNSIDDIIPGVTLNLHKAGEKEVKIDVKPDTEKMKEAIITFVGHYNQLLKDIQILTSRDEAVIAEIEYLSDDEKKEAEKRLGLMQGDMTLQQMKNSLQRIMMDPYPTSKGRDLSLLAQIGISTNSGSFGGAPDARKLRGYLEINEQTLDNALKDNPSAVQELFGSDTNNDLVVDSGVAYAIDTYARGYTQTGGILALKISGLDRAIERNQRDIETYTAKLEQKQEELKRKYGMMEGALSTLEQNSQTIENFNRSTTNKD
ncbi:MAG TPA: flagellar filament capping protein FliD [Spirochaetia bacterium]|nr:flagellar filament capping protein FliD [Spirochaetia bacterium]